MFIIYLNFSENESSLSSFTLSILYAALSQCLAQYPVQKKYSIYVNKMNAQIHRQKSQCNMVFKKQAEEIERIMSIEKMEGVRSFSEYIISKSIKKQ